MKLLLAVTTAAVAVALALPSLAPAGIATLTTRAVPLQAGDHAAASAPGRFDLVGVRWRGSGSVQLSVRSTSGRWGPWLDAAPEEEDEPDVGSPEGRAARGWRLGNPTWVGPSTAIRYRLLGRVDDLRATFVRSPELRIPMRRSLAVAGAPPIVTRSGWGANESIVKGTPTYAPAIRFASVHHTAGPNTYTAAEVPAILRAIQLYHVRSNGWNDIGYNFLVDRYGTVYEGRAGGVDRNVVGAHIRGFNTGAVGVALIGTFTSAPVPAAAETALERLLAWRLDLAHVDPLSSLTFVSGGSERYVSGTAVTLRAVSGHRDTGLTTCPGDVLYARLGTIAADAARIGLPKLYEPKVSGGLGSRIRFQARLSGPLAWKVAVTDTAGQELAAGTGQGTAVDWTWDATLAAVSGARWRIEAAGAAPATGTLGKATGGTSGGPLAITGLAADPATISPNGDGTADVASITFTTSASATVAATLLDQGGSELAELAAPAMLPAGRHTIPFDGLDQPDGVYTVAVTAVGADGAIVRQEVQVTLSRTLGPVSLAPAVLTPNGDGIGDELLVSFQLFAAADVRLRVLREGAWIATPYAGRLEPGDQTVGWNGQKRIGRPLDGRYTAVLEATDAVGTTQVSLPFALDARAPTVKLLARPARLWVSEPAAVTVTVNGSRRRLTANAPGYLALTGIRTVRSIVVVARDQAGNATVLRRP